MFLTESHFWTFISVIVQPAEGLQLVYKIPNPHMLQYYLGVYGVVVCVIGYLYALVEWHLRNRRYTMAIEHRPSESTPQTIRSVCSNSSEHSCQPDVTEENCNQSQKP
ncbi:hypothetical protein PHET_00240 [Paragonimus heterotremus]|uniref:Uncharacterized protein n=2 Tax=Paragonimus TaxID=34503 RepID=A0A8J4TT22_9TREM|nr:hypothetical protein PHET_00240 [Paragonimus heterotremus]